MAKVSEPITETKHQEPKAPTPPSLPRILAAALLPLLALGVMIWFGMTRGGQLSPLEVPPIEKLTIERMVFKIGLWTNHR